MNDEFENHLKKRGALNPLNINELQEIDNLFKNDIQQDDGIERLQYYIGRPVRVITPNGHVNGWVLSIDSVFIVLNTNRAPLSKDKLIAMITTSSLEAIEEIGVTTEDPQKHDEAQAEKLIQLMQEQQNIPEQQ